MSRRVSKPAAALLAVVISLSAPAAFAASRDRGVNPGDRYRIVRIIKEFAKKLGIVTHEDVQWPSPPKP